MDDNANISGVTAEEAQMSFLQRLSGIFFEPAKTFEDISRKRSWVAMLILMSLVTLGASYTLRWRMDPADAAIKGMAMTKPLLKRFLSAEQLTQMEAQAAKQALQPPSFWAKYSPIVLTPLTLYVVYVILAAIFLLAFMMTGAGISFRKSFTVAFWGMGPPAIVVTLLSILFIFVKNPADLDINPANNVVSNLGPLVDSVTHPALHSLFASVDLFSLWTIILLSVGFAAMSEKKLTPGKAAVPIVALWGLWVLLKMGFWSIMS